MFENDTQVCAVLRHFKSDSPYLTLEDDSWIQELNDEDNYFLLFDWVLAYTNGLESLYLLKSDQKKSEILANRVAIVLGKDDKDENHLRDIVKQFYKVGNAIVHGSLLDEAQDSLMRKNIWSYQDILRKSILAFLDLNQKSPTKKAAVSQIRKAATDPILRRTIRESLVLLNLAK
jgi:hypothetical protein